MGPHHKLSHAIVDIGANLTHASFQADLPDVLARAHRAGVGTIVVTGTSVEGSRAALALAQAHSHIYATAGVHPHEAAHCNSDTLPALRSLLGDPRVVAVGECGLDFNRNYSPHPDQEKWFVAQLELACELGKPLFLHSRDAHPRFAQILRDHEARLPPSVAHCFTGEADELRAYLDLGLYIGITGWICDERRGRHLLELVREIPADRLMIETDAPYLTPRTMRPQPHGRRNEPAFLPHILEAIAAAVAKPVDELARTTSENAKRFFGL
ncbi:MAG: YchF/TatD family DNA exonuclease [Proteobacteria bacterium]|nr:YchF/TatD family DNA exonuclease [Pseudomonadota bacterium]